MQVRPPQLYLIDDGFPRLFAVGRGPGSSSLAVSTGALHALRPEELEAVIGHELAHVRRRDVLVQTSVVLFATTLVELSRIGGWFSRFLLYVFAPIASAFVNILLATEQGARGRRARSRARPAARTTSRTPCIASTARRSSSSSPRRRQPSRSIPIDPFVDEGVARMFKTHPPLETRLRRLRELGATASRNGDNPHSAEARRTAAPKASSTDAR